MYVTVEIDLDVIETYDLIYELKDRGLSLKSKQDLIDIIGKSEFNEEPFVKLIDNMKFKVFFNNINNKTLEQLERFYNG